MESEIRKLILPLSETLIKQLTLLHQQNSDPPPDLFALEFMVVRLLAQFATSLLAALVQLWYGRGKALLPVNCLQCQKSLSLQAYLSRPVLSCFGRFSYERAYYYCRSCHQGRFPLDEQLGI